MSDLISRSNLLQEFEIETSIHRNSELWHITGIKAYIENEPTAYDVDKVIEQLGGMLQEKRKMYLRGNRDENRYFYEIHILEEVIDIIRAGGKE